MILIFSVCCIILLLMFLFSPDENFDTTTDNFMKEIELLIIGD